MHLPVVGHRADVVLPRASLRVSEQLCDVSERAGPLVVEGPAPAAQAMRREVRSAGRSNAFAIAVRSACGGWWWGLPVKKAARGVVPFARYRSSTMTWAIAMPGFPTGGVLLADVRVSFVDPSTGRIIEEVDGLQKVHPIAPNLAVAFSGSVEAGLFIADQLRLALAGLPPDELWSPAQIAHQCSRRLEHLWETLTPEVRAGGCELLLGWCLPEPQSGAVRAQ